MKKIITAFLLIALLFSISAFAAPEMVGVENAEEITQEAVKEETASLAATYTEGYFKYSVSNGEATITDCDTSISGDVVIPATLGGYPVTSIGSDAFYYCTSLASIEIPSGVTSIGSDAFYYCTSLTSIEIPDSVTSIGSYAFYKCTSLASVTIGENSQLTSIGDDAFSNCTSLESVYITDLASWCNIKFTTTASSPLYNRADLYINNELAEEITIPEGITSINSCTLYGCTSVKSIKIPSGVTSIGSCAFSDCTSLKSVTFGENSQLTSIGSDAFYYCTSLASIEIPSGVTSIGEWAFYNCTSLESVYITDLASWCNIEFIGFASSPLCNGVDLYINNALAEEITIPEGITSINSYILSGCTSVKNIKIPSGVTSIGGGAFDDCTSLASIEIPSGVKSIGFCAFDDCTSLESVTFGENSQLTSIGDYVFRNCKSLASIEIPDSVTSIVYEAFYKCTSLASIEIPSGVTSIGDYAFGYCDSLKSITIPDSVTSIGDYAFFDCSKLIIVYYEGSEDDWNNISIGSNNEYLTNALIVTDNQYILTYNANNGENAPDIQYATRKATANLTTQQPNREGYEFVGWSTAKDGEVEYASGAEYLGDANVELYAVWKCVAFGPCGFNLKWAIKDNVLTITGSGSMTNWSSYSSVPWYNYRTEIQKVVISDDAKNISNFAFYNCTKLAEIKLGNSLQTIGSQAFYNCSSLASIEFTDNLTTIESQAFYNCSGFEKIEFGNNVETIGSNAFSYCSGLLKIEIPDSVKTIGNAFQYCRSLAHVSIGSGAKSISSGAFYRCDMLEKIVVSPENEYYSSDAYGILFNKDKETLIQYPIGNKSTGYTVPSTVKTIGSNSFGYCQNLENLNLGSNTNTIEKSAFYNCKNLKKIYLPVSVTKIYSSAFDGTVSIENVYYEGTLEQLESIDIGDYNDGFLNADFSFAYVVTYTISYNTLGGSSDIKKQDKKHGEPITLSTEVPKKIGHTFKGWATEQNGEVIYNPGDEYTGNVDLTLYAVWEEVKGDASGDGKLTIDDVFVAIDAILGKTLTEEEFKYANVYDEDDEINIKDIIKLAQMMSQIQNA